MNSNTQPGTPSDAGVTPPSTGFTPSSTPGATPGSALGTANPAKGGVPVAIYKEVTAELQATRAMVDALNGRNQQLAQENQLLRQEIDRFFHNVSHLQGQLAAPSAAPSAHHVIHPKPAAKTFNPFQPKSLKAADRLEPPTPEAAATANSIATQLRGADLNLLNLRSHVDERDRLRPESKLKELNGIWLTLTVIAVILTAFGAGFLIVRPFLPSR